MAAAAARLLSFDIGIYNMAYCLAELGEPAKIIKWEKICLKDKKEKIDFNELVTRLIDTLETLFDTEPLDFVLIENQPCIKAPTMKSLQMVIYTFFMIRRIHVKLVSAMNKLKVSLNKEHEKEKLTYAEKKKAAVRLTKAYIGDTGEWPSHFAKEKDSPDLSDAYLQMVWFIEKELSITPLPVAVPTRS
jgi:hypothetical protein